MMDVEKAVRALKRLEKDGSADKEGTHVSADSILLQCVDPKISKAYNDLEEKIGGFWYA